MEAFYRHDYRNYYQATIKPSAAYKKRYYKEQRLTYTAELIASRVGLQSGMRVLDVGCAEGTLFLKLAEIQSDLAFVGIEPSEEFSNYASEASGCTVYPDMKSLLSAEESKFDLIVVNHVLEHMSDPLSILGELFRMLAANGRIFVDVPDADQYRAPESLHVAHLTHFTSRTIVACLQQAGFSEIVTACHQPPHHPPSVFCVAKSFESPILYQLATSPSSEEVAWRAIRRIESYLPFYLFRRRLHHSEVAKRFVRKVRSLRKYLIG